MRKLFSQHLYVLHKTHTDAFSTLVDFVYFSFESSYLVVLIDADNEEYQDYYVKHLTSS